LPRRGWLADRLAQHGVASRILPYKTWAALEGGPPWRRVARLGWNLVLVLPAALWLRRSGVQVVYTNVSTTGFGAFAAALSRRSHVWHIRELGYEHGRTVFDLGERLTLRLVRSLSRLCLANSECVAAKYREALRPTEIRVVYQGVRLDDADGGAELGPPRGLRCVAVGSLHAGKRQDEAIEALGRLAGRGRDAELLVVGRGDPGYERELRALVARLGLGERVRFLGQLDSAGPAIRSAHVVVNCSRNEAFGRVTVEGMLAGKPVVGSRSAGTAELIRDGVTGLLYEPGDVAGLAAILERLIDDPAEGQRLGAAARAWATARFAEQRFGDELLACLLPLAGEAPRGR
jgi:glycosyltransferase involved in cell wall biosynthesis